MCRHVSANFGAVVCRRFRKSLAVRSRTLVFSRRHFSNLPVRKRESYSSYAGYYSRVILDKYFFMLHKELLIEIHDALRKAPAFALSKCAKRRTTWEERCERAYPLNVNVARTCSKHFKEEDIDHTCPQKRKFGIQRKTFLKNEAIPSRNLQTR